MPTHFRLIALCLLPNLLLGCKKDDEKLGKVKVELDNVTSAGLRLTESTGTREWNEGTYKAYTPSQFSMKMKIIYLVENIIDYNNSGAMSYIWLNPACPVETHDNGAISMAGGDCDSSLITSKFDLSRTSEKVNADLNSQQIPVNQGTYNYVRMETCGNNDKSENISFLVEGIESPFSFNSERCYVEAVKIDPPLTVTEDTVVRLNLKYDLANLIFDPAAKVSGDGTDIDMTWTMSDSCTKTDDQTGFRCYEDISFTPTIL